VDIVADSVIEAQGENSFKLKDRDVIGLTESIVAKAQGNYVTVDEVADEIKSKFHGEVGVVFPILSRNRFSLILKAIARGSKKVGMLLKYPEDEVGNPVMDKERLYELKINPFSDLLTEKDYIKHFSDFRHPNTGINYVNFYRNLVESEKARFSVVFSNNPEDIFYLTSKALVADIHTRKQTKKILENSLVNVVYGLEDICSTPCNDKGYNEDYGLLGSNKMSEESLKLFPRVKDENGKVYVDEIQKKIKEKTGKNVEVMIYGDGAFKDPHGIWELADPVVSPSYNKGLEGSPNELKLKYIAENFKELNQGECEKAIKDCIRSKDKNLFGKMESQGTTPRQYTDLLGSLCDLISGSGDKGTPIVLIQGYFDNYASE
ncbi:MAG: coenzyme F420-0:L-glutamate ligase, partial [Candidatus Nanoarchaeia archaeon]|nr:coenzyme F420-0:L-glutamate ligase [Candidatus Nanoarchaeia archaeon]